MSISPIAAPMFRAGRGSDRPHRAEVCFNDEEWAVMQALAARIGRGAKSTTARGMNARALRTAVLATAAQLGITSQRQPSTTETIGEATAA